eukprot:4816940-Amphidinium_carterae.3
MCTSGQVVGTAGNGCSCVQRKSTTQATVQNPQVLVASQMATGGRSLGRLGEQRHGGGCQEVAEHVVHAG